MSTSISKKKPVIKIKFSIGFGNNLFQYVFSKLLAENHNGVHSHPYLPGFKYKSKNFNLNKKLKTINVKKKEYETGAYKRFFKKTTTKFNYNLVGYFEDYTIYKPHLKKIRNWFPKIKKTHKKDLIIHLRLQNRLIEVNHFLNLIEPKKYISLLKKFNYKNLHIITDLEKWDEYSTEDILKIQKDVSNGPNPGTAWISINESKMYVNTLINEFSKYDPVVHCSNSSTIYGSGGLRGDFMKAFNFIRKFDQVILFNSTFSWWAAVLSGASKVAVFSLWKPGREKNSPNLGSTNYKGWFNYGGKKDLISNRPRYKKYKKNNWSERYIKSYIYKRLIQIFRLFSFYKKYNSKRDYH